jgi:hypothetical protein
MMNFAEHLSAILRKLYHYILLNGSLVEGYGGVGFHLMLFLLMQNCFNIDHYLESAGVTSNTIPLSLASC